MPGGGGSGGFDEQGPEGEGGGDPTLAEEAEAADAGSELYAAPDDEGEPNGGDMDDDRSSGLDSLGCYVGDTGFSIPAVWTLLNSLKPMTKAQADQVLSSAIDVTDWATRGLSGSDQAKARAHAEALSNTRASIANASADPLSEPDAGGVRTMVADGFTYANLLATQNAANAEHLSMLWGDLKDNAMSLPGKLAGAVSSAVDTIGSGLKWIAIGGGVLIALVGGVFVYRRVRA